MASPYHTADPLALERYRQQLARALGNPNLAASVVGSPTHEACVQRIEEVRAAIAEGITPAAIRAAKKAKQ